MNLNQVTISVTDVERSIRFYQMLGLEMIVEALPHYARFICDGDATFSLHKVGKPPDGSATWVYFELDDLDLFVQSLLSKGVRFEELPNDKPWLWREARLRDPDDNIIILYHAGENRRNPPWRLK
ncbi:VOC family protein [Segetibacter sp. 3557_3]|uniref:VOC family protein n=1 Tax=Segetibacter sp. 3557_3 TaxID=2547429 RepID=UPI001058F7FF|nr:VOC family protein [Segetibacter sp. 3557_3]TDH28564.1 VOC family protein [Segetibacter sp. 3557_3]